MKAVGARLPRYDGIGHVTGRTQYVDDVRVGKTLWVKALRSPHHNAAITSFDASKAEAMKGVYAVITHEDVPAERLRPSRRARRSRRRAAARRRRGPLPGPADRRRRGGVRSSRQRRGAGDRDHLRGASRALRHPQGARPGGPADPPVGQRLSALRPVQPPAGAQGRHRPCVRRGGHDRRGRLPPAGDRADAARDAGRARRAGGERPADDLLVHAGDVLLDGRRRGAPESAAEQAEVRRRHRRRRLRRQGRHRRGHDLRAARAEGAQARSSGAGRAKRSSSRRRRGRRGTSSSQTRSRRTAGSSAAGR